MEKITTNEKWWGAKEVNLSRTEKKKEKDFGQKPRESALAWWESKKQAFEKITKKKQSRNEET